MNETHDFRGRGPLTGAAKELADRLRNEAAQARKMAEDVAYVVRQLEKGHSFESISWMLMDYPELLKKFETGAAA